MTVPSRLGLIPRAAAVGVVLVLEALLLSYLMKSALFSGTTGDIGVLRDIQQWLFRFVIAYAGSLALLSYLGERGTTTAQAALAIDSPLRVRWWVLHLGLVVMLALLSAELYSPQPRLPLGVLASARPLCAIAAAVALAAGMAPLSLWWRALRRAGAIPLYAILPAAAAVAAIRLSQLLWAPAAKLTFAMVQVILRPFYEDIRSDPGNLILGTPHFVVQVTEVCSGLEGVGLMLAFCIGWLWYFRREYRWPRALLVIPAAVLLVFLLNAARIAALVAIGDAGFESIATVGFHSQAGWIAFNLAAFTVAVVSRRSAWLNRSAHAAAQPRTRADNPTAAFLMPILAILAAGMLAHALSAGFDVLYPLRLAAGAAMLFFYRRSYRNLVWAFTWRSVVVGTVIFAMWAVCAHFLSAPSPQPDALTRMTAPARAIWIVCRAAAAIITVPLAEELAYRGYLMRRIVDQNFEAVEFRAVPWTALAMVSVVFGITHGSMWLPGIVAGFAYGWLVVRTGRIGEAVGAHAVTNAWLAGFVLLFDQWQLW